MKKFPLYITLAISLLTGCSLDKNTDVSCKAMHQVSFTAGMGVSRTVTADNMLSTLWCADDEISLWAENTDGQKILSAETFTYAGSENSPTGTFMATIAAMPGGYHTHITQHIRSPQTQTGTRLHTKS